MEGSVAKLVWEHDNGCVSFEKRLDGLTAHPFDSHVQSGLPFLVRPPRQLRIAFSQCPHALASKPDRCGAFFPFDRDISSMLESFDRNSPTTPAYPLAAADTRGVAFDCPIVLLSFGSCSNSTCTIVAKFLVIKLLRSIVLVLQTNYLVKEFVFNELVGLDFQFLL